MPHAGKVALVTGVTSGLGRAVARRFALQGAAVLGVARREALGRELEKELRDAGGALRFVAADVRRVEDCRRAVDAALGAFGRLDVLVNNAGVEGDPPVQPSHGVTEEQWDAVVDTNLKGAFFCARFAIPAMIEQGGGVILNIASINAIEGPARMAAYSASKAGLVQLSRTLAVEYLAEGIRVNAIILGGVASEAQERSTRAYARFVRGEEAVDTPAAPAAFLQDPDDVARALALLCEADAAPISGATIAIDRTMTAGLMASTLVYMTSAGLWTLDPAQAQLSSARPRSPGR
jgi:NAD(P)-dependent dehydrogenase (short-subunit alcohol dehydrogenase family)